MISRSVPLEICICADNTSLMQENIASAITHGAKRIELCRDMSQDGLTPSANAIRLARQAAGKGELLVMLRPRGGDFVYTKTEYLEFLNGIKMAVDEGADGIVIGLLTPWNAMDFGRIDEAVNYAKEQSLAVTFHRAFDALSTPLSAARMLSQYGVLRILTSGTPWRSGQGAVQGIVKLKQLINSDIDIEWVIGGGVTADSATSILAQLQGDLGKISLHSYSGVLTGDRVDPQKVRQLANLATG